MPEKWNISASMYDSYANPNMIIGSTTLTELVYLVMNDDNSPETTPTRRPPNTTTKNFTIPSSICKWRNGEY
ncbi:hypothetical protein DPMN_140076 [Dreissena polymorpha]|uniref:Uncharacterized protein n=1 Tax=Dreissena polymorpha TaxID=45954 RepID=A0A9D4G9S9_DREPO|nr:hypothetical protein DPMN_140076 [Dreissena polymorpha]